MGLRDQILLQLGESAGKASQLLDVALGQLAPRAPEQLREALASTLDEGERPAAIDLCMGDLACIAQQWCAEHDRDFNPYLVVHDAVHALIEAPPTVQGEQAVVSYQLKHQVLDPTWVGVWPVVMSGAVTSKLGWPRYLWWLLRRWAQLRVPQPPPDPHQILALLADAASHA